jgi:type III pantothenate kinase
MNCLVIDAGNTRCKLAVFSGSELQWQESLAALSLLHLEKIIATYNPVSTILSSVVHLDTELVKFIGLLPNALILDENTPLPLVNGYATPKTLGRDRLANAVAAKSLFQNRNVLVMDAGTCLKFDFTDKAGTYQGGAISPGLHMRYESLQRFTDQLPLLAPVDEAKLTGNSTDSSIHSGILNGMRAEIEGVINRYESVYDNLQLILTGGDARYFLNHLKKSIFASPELTLKGLHFILLYNYHK